MEMGANGLSILTVTEVKMGAFATSVSW